MRAVIQRVARAEVLVVDEGGSERSVGRIGRGLLVYVGVGETDTPAVAAKLAGKVARMRIFPDEDGRMNRAAGDVRGGILAVPNFTLQADARKGRRPSFVGAADPDRAKPLHEAFVAELRKLHEPVAAGEFGAHMHVESVADGPVNIVLDVVD